MIKEYNRERSLKQKTAEKTRTETRFCGEKDRGM